MPPKIPKYLDDIRDAAQFVIDLVHGRTLDDYRRDRVLRQTVERNFEIIGEAMNRIVKLDPNTAARIGNYPRIIAFSNVLTHGYDMIEEDRVWSVIQRELPTLRDQVELLLREGT